MRFEIAFADDAAPYDVEITLAGQATLVAFAELTRTLLGDSRFRPGLVLLVDISALDTSSLGDEGLAHLTSSIAERDWNYPPQAVAIIAADGPGSDDARFYRAHLGGSRSGREIFRTREDALDWLRQST